MAKANAKGSAKGKGKGQKVETVATVTPETVAEVKAEKAEPTPAEKVAKAQARRMTGRDTTPHTIGAVRNKGREMATALLNVAFPQKVDGVALVDALAWLIAPSLVAEEIALTLAPAMDAARVLNGRESGYYTGTGRTAKGFPTVGIRDGAGRHSWATVRDSFLAGFNEVATECGAEGATVADWAEAAEKVGRGTDGATA